MDWRCFNNASWRRLPALRRPTFIVWFPRCCFLGALYISLGGLLKSKLMAYLVLFFRQWGLSQAGLRPASGNFASVSSFKWGSGQESLHSKNLVLGSVAYFLWLVCYSSRNQARNLFVQQVWVCSMSGVFFYYVFSFNCFCMFWRHWCF
jgi:hypothetical protein